MTRAWPLTGRSEELRTVVDTLTGGRQFPAGVILVGEAGVGKTRLARAAGGAVMASGYTVHTVTATVANRSIPLGAFSQWVTHLDGNPILLVNQVISALQSHTNPASDPPVVVVDDAHLLDELSLFILCQLALQRRARLLLTARTGEPAPAGLTGLWKDGYLSRLDVQPLSRSDVDELLLSVLGAAPNAETGRRLWELTRGNILFLRGLVEQERRDGRLRIVDDEPRRHLQWSGDVVLSPSLVGIIDKQIGVLGTAVRDALDLVALAEPIEYTVLSRLADPTVLEEAEQRGLIEVSPTATTEMVRMGHPLFGQVCVSRCGPARRRRLAGLLARQLVQFRPPHGTDPVRVGALWLDSDMPPDRDIMLAAAGAAARRLDVELAERLAHAACEVDESVESTVLRVHMLILLLRSREAEELLRDVGTGSLTIAAKAELLTVRAANLLWPLADPPGAAALIDDALHTADTVLAHPVRASKAVQLAVSGRPVQALEVLERVDPAMLDDVSDAYRCWAAALALGDRGRTDAALAVVSQADQISERCPRAAYQAVGIAEYAVTAAVAAGRLTESRNVADELVHRCASTPGIAHSVALAIAATSDVANGLVSTACTRLSAALDRFERLGDSSGLIYRFGIVHTEALARSGDRDAAGRAELHMHQSSHPAFGFAEPDAMLSSAWVAAVTGDVERARTLSHAAADIAHARGQLAREVVCLQTSAQFGDGTGADRLHALADCVEGPRAPAAAQLAQAVGTADPHRLMDAATQFEAFGDLLTAADCLGQSAALFRTAGARTSELTAVGRARRLLAGTGAVVMSLRDAASALPLTRREREVLMLLTTGMSSGQIADALTMSVRTVEGHVYRANGKLGTTSRVELAALLSEWDGLPDG